MIRSMFAIALLAVASSAVAAPTDYVFDTVRRFDFAGQISVTGILQGSTTETSVTWNETPGGSYVVIANRCVPLFLTMMEKPGRYTLNLRVDPAIYDGTISCGLELRN
jgi:hypothetical protein